MRRILAALALLAGLHAAMAQTPPAQNWPSKPVRVIVPVTPGSALDITARVIAERLSAQLGQTFVVENRTGAGGTIGAAFVAKSDPDGYTILIHSTAVTIFPATFANLPFDTARDFAAVTPAVSVPLVLVVSPSRHKSLKGLVAAAKAKPGSINYATVGAGAAAHMTAERLRLSAGFEAQQIPFRGAPEAQTEVVAGRVDFFFSPVLVAQPLIKCRSALGARREQLAALDGAAGRADHGRGRLSEFRLRILARLLPAGQDPARHRRAALPGNPQGQGAPRREGEARRVGRRADGHDARRSSRTTSASRWR